MVRKIHKGKVLFYSAYRGGRRRRATHALKWFPLKVVERQAVLENYTYFLK